MISPAADPQRIVAAIPEQPLGNHVATPRASRPSGASPGGDAGTGRTGHRPPRRTLEKDTRPAVRGRLLDEADRNRSWGAAIHLNGSLQTVVSAADPRGDIARWKGTSGRHGVLWPGGRDGDGTRIDVFDADTGQPLSGSPALLKGGQVVAGAGGVG